MLVALETGLRISEADDFAYKHDRFNTIIAAVRDIPGVVTDVFVSEGHANELYLDIDWDTDIIRLTPDDLARALQNHDPIVEVRAFMFSGGRIQLSATVMDEGEEESVGQIIRKVLLEHS